MKDYYKLLEINENASVEVIKASYKALIKKYHPDNNGGNNEVSNKRMILINEAYEVLSDELKRKEYDSAYKKYINKTEHSAYEDDQLKKTGTSASNANTRTDGAQHSYSGNGSQSSGGETGNSGKSSCLGSIIVIIIAIWIISALFRSCNKTEDSSQAVQQTENVATDNHISNDTDASVQDNSTSNKTPANIITTVTDELNRTIYAFSHHDLVFSKCSEYVQDEEEGIPPLYLEASEEFFGKKVTYKVINSEDADEYSYLYRGGIKDGKPQGIGLLYKFVPFDVYNCNFIVYEGWFENGTKYGYGMEYYLPTYDQISELSTIYYDRYMEQDMTSEEATELSMTSMISGLNYLVYEGEFDENGLYSGYGNEYIHLYWEFPEVFYMDFDVLDEVSITMGEFSKGKLNGYGVSYSGSGEILYEGNWVNGDYE